MTYRPPPLGPKTLRLTAAAEQDLDDIVIHLAAEAGRDVALRFASHLDAEFTKLSALGHSVSREWVSPQLRLHIIGNYCVFFRLTDTETRIVRLLHGHRDMNAIIFEPPANDQPG
jgi:plasmid stabilization system protein ParE